MVYDNFTKRMISFKKNCIEQLDAFVAVKLMDTRANICFCIKNFNKSVLRKVIIKPTIFTQIIKFNKTTINTVNVIKTITTEERLTQLFLEELDIIYNEKFNNLMSNIKAATLK